MFFKQVFTSNRPPRVKINPFVRVFILAESLMWPAINLSTPIFAIFVAQDIAGGNVETAAFSFTVYYIFRVAAELFAGKVLNNSSEQFKLKAVAVGILVTAVSYLGFAFVSQLAMLYFYQGLSGIGLGFLTPAKNSLFSTHLDKGRETSEWGTYDALVFLGMGAAAALGGIIAERYGFKLLFVISAVMISLTVIPYWVYFRKYIFKNVAPAG